MAAIPTRNRDKRGKGIKAQASPDASQRAAAKRVQQPSPPEVGNYITVAEAGLILRACTKTVRARIRVGELEAYRVGRRILIPRDAVERLIKRGRL
jgi:excisionase family DNA binding protein